MEKRESKYTSDLFNRIGDEKRQRIHDAAVNEFAQNGFASANVNRIAETAGISIGSLYKYFETKDDLFMYIVDESAQMIHEYTQEILQSDRDIMKKIESLLYLAYEYSLKEPDLIKLYNVFTSDNDDKRAALIADRLESVTSGAYRTLISEAQQNGKIRDDIDPGVLAVMIDNQLMATQFAFANIYYNKRLKLYLGFVESEYENHENKHHENKHNHMNDQPIDIDHMISNMMEALKSMLIVNYGDIK